MAEHDPNSRQYFERRMKALKQERQSFDSHAKDLSQNIQPRRGRFLTSDRNKGGKRHQFIINSHATWALRTARTGLFAGVMNPARPWFRYRTDDPDLMEFGPVKVWLNQVETLHRDIFDESNLYNMAPTMLGELMLFGTGCMLHVDDFDDVARFYTQTFGSYVIAQNARQQVDTLGLESERTVEQLVKQFGLKNVSQTVKDQWDRGTYDTWHKVAHMIEPNPDFDPRQPGNRFKAWRSIKYQPDNQDTDKFLSRSGFDRFPAYCPRWEVTGEDIYGTDCPAMTALGDIRGLQIEEKRKAQAIAKMVNPPLHGPASLRDKPVQSIPGGLTTYDTGQGTNKLDTIYKTDPRIQELMLDIEKIEGRIGRAFFVDLFMSISNLEGVQPKSEFQLSQVNQESLIQLAPTLGRVHGEFLNRMVDRLFDQTVQADILPEAPPELQGKELKVEFISSLAQAQHAVATGNIDRLFAFISTLAQVPGYESVTDKGDADQAVDEYSHLIGAPANLVVPDDKVEERRQARAEAEQQQRQQEQMLELAKAGLAPATTAGQADLTQDTPISRSVENVQQALDQR